MTPATTKRRRRLAFIGASTAAAMVLLPSAAAQADPLGDIIGSVTDVANAVTGTGAVPAGPALPAVPLVAPAVENPILGSPDDDDDTGSHETDDPLTPDHAGGENVLGQLGAEAEHDIADVDKYEAGINSDGSAYGDVTLLGLFGDELIGSHSSSDGPTSQHSNPTEFLCEGTGGALCLSLLYTDTAADENAEGSAALARGGVAAVCLFGSNGEADASYDCEDSFLATGVAEGAGAIARDGAGADKGKTEAASANETLNLCLIQGPAPELPLPGDADCEGFGTRVLHSDSSAEADKNGASEDRNSYLLGFQQGGNAVSEVVGDPGGIELFDCSGLALLCVFVNQGESFIFETVAGNDGAAAAQEALHVDLLTDTPLAILAELGKSEALARFAPGDDGVCDPNGNDPDCDEGEETECNDGQDNDGDGLVDLDDPDCSGPDDDSEGGDAECNDGVDNDGDNKIDFGSDPGCDSASDDSEKDKGLASTGADVAPLLAGAFALIGFGALTVAATRRREGRHSA